MTEMEVMKQRNDVARRLEHTSSIHRNCIRINAGSTKRHEEKKFEIAWRLAKEGKEFITEAVFKKEGVRADIVCLDTKEIFEIETNPRDFELRKSDYPDDFKINLVEV